jgi:hypothetical membrane protein
MNEPHRRALWLAGLAWIATGLYFPLQVIVARASPQPYSFLANTISDLGVTACGVPSTAAGRDVPVCSPWHAAMNIGFIVFGVLTITGAALIARAVPRTRWLTIVLACVVVAGVGGIVVGLAPSDRAPGLHKVGALLRVPGVIAPLILEATLWERHPRLAAFCFGITGASVGGMAWFAHPSSSGWAGAAERLALDPFTIWTIVLGARLAARPVEEARRLFD